MSDQSQVPEVLLFGGTFDPPHRGHRRCIEAVLEKFPRAECWVLPSYAPPVSKDQQKDVATSFEHRLRMARLAFEEISRVLVKEIESRLPGPSYTSQTWSYLKKNELLGKRCAWVIGRDQLLSFHKWKDFETLLTQLDIVVCDRDLDGSALGDAVLTSLTNCKVENIAVGDEAGVYRLDTGRRIYALTDVNEAVASRDLRNDSIQQWQDWVDPKVRDYAIKHDLY